MVDRTQQVNGAVSIVGPQPQRGNSSQVATNTALGLPTDEPAGNGRPGSVIAQLAAISMQLQETNELLLSMNNLFEQMLAGRH